MFADLALIIMFVGLASLVVVLVRRDLDRRRRRPPAVWELCTRSRTMPNDVAYITVQLEKPGESAIPIRVIRSSDPYFDFLYNSARAEGEERLLTLNSK